jgi:hypothetical protein
MNAHARPTTAEPIVIAEWWKNRAGESIRIRLSTYQGHNFIDVRSWYTSDGKLCPGKGFACSVRHLPRLIKARELGLLTDGGSGHHE